MRTIKFRVWDSRLKKFEYFDIFTSFGHIPGDCKENIQQFTGLKDTNECEIYEGDIINYSLGNHLYIEKIVWENDGFRVVTLNGDSSTPLAGISNICEVIGNIFENPELSNDE